MEARHYYITRDICQLESDLHLAKNGEMVGTAARTSKTCVSVPPDKECHLHMQSPANVINAKDHKTMSNFHTSDRLSVPSIKQQQPTRATMPLTYLQILHRLALTNRLHKDQPTISKTRKRVEKQRGNQSSCSLALCRDRRDGREMLVFKTTGPGREVDAVRRNLPCGECGCWVCGRLLGKHVLI